MKKIFVYVLIAVMLVMPVISLAAEFRGGEQVSIGKEEKVANDLYMAGGSITSAGSVSGDLIMAGGNIVISGDVGSDLTVGGGNVNILSTVGDDLRAGGGTVIVAGQVKGDAMIGGGQITLGGSGVGGDVAIAGGNVRIDAPVTGKLFVAGGNVYIDSLIGGDVKIEAQKITLGKNAVISGNLTYKASAEMTKEEGAVVKGTVDFKLIEKKTIPREAFVAIFSALLLWKFFALLVCALVLGLVFRRYSKEIVSLATIHSFSKLGKGIVIMIVMPIIAILLFVTMVGIPFGVLGLIGFVALMLVAWIMTPVVVGSLVYRYFSKKDLEVSWKTILLGVFIYSLLGVIPFIGGLAQTLIMLLVLGSMMTLKWQILKEWR